MKLDFKFDLPRFFICQDVSVCMSHVCEIVQQMKCKFCRHNIIVTEPLNHVSLRSVFDLNLGVV